MEKRDSSASSHQRHQSLGMTSSTALTPGLLRKAGDQRPHPHQHLQHHATSGTHQRQHASPALYRHSDEPMSAALTLGRRSSSSSVQHKHRSADSSSNSPATSHCYQTLSSSHRYSQQQSTGGSTGTLYAHRKQTPLPEPPAGCDVQAATREVEMTRAMKETFESLRPPLPVKQSTLLRNKAQAGSLSSAPGAGLGGDGKGAKADISLIKQQQQQRQMSAMGVRRKPQSVSEVTRQAGRVLERFLSYSSQKDYFSEMEGGGWRAGASAGFYSDTGASRLQPGGHMSSGDQDDTESDYVDMMHLLAEASLASTMTRSRFPVSQPVAESVASGDYYAATTATTATTTTTASSSVASRSHSPKSDRILFPINTHQQSHHHAGGRHHRHHHQKQQFGHLPLPELDNSSSSTEDYEYCDNDLLARKKKSFLRRAKEQFRHTFRRFRDLTTSGGGGGGGDTDVETSPRDDLGVQDVGVCKKPKKKRKLTSSASFGASSSAGSKLRLSFRPSGGAGSVCSGEAGAGGGGGAMVGGWTDAGACIEVHGGRLVATNSNLTFQPIDDVSMMGGVRRRSPVPWKNWEVRSRSKADGGKDKESIFESFFRQFRKNSLKSKSRSSKDRQKSRSADNLVIRPLTKDEQRLLRQHLRQAAAGGVDVAHQQQQGLGTPAAGDRRREETDEEIEASHQILQGGSLNRTPKRLTSLPPVTPVFRPVPLLASPAHPVPGVGAQPSVARSFSTPTGEAAVTTTLRQADRADPRQHQQQSTLHHPQLVPSSSTRSTRPRTPVEQVIVTRGAPNIGGEILASQPVAPAAVAVGPRSTTPVEMVFVTPGQVKKKVPALMLKADIVEDHDYVQIEGDETPGELFEKIGVKADTCDGPARQDVTKAHHERTEREKDEMYEKIAQQLAFIADNYGVELTASAATATAASSRMTSSSDEATGGGRGNRSSGSSLEGVQIATKPTAPLEMELAALLREKGDSAGKPTATELVEQLVHNTSYSTFKEVVGQRLGPQEGWQQVAQMFRLTQVAVQCAGLGSAVAQQIQQHTLKYFEDRFASWIVDQGGWESVVEDTNTEGDSELD